MSVGFPEVSLSHYVHSHTGCVESSWNTSDPAYRGLFPFAAINTPNDHEFLEFIRSHLRSSPVCNPLDGQEHDLFEIVNWLGDGRCVSAFRFVSLGVGLDVFLIVPGTWDSVKRLPPGPVNREPMKRWIEQRVRAGEACRFQCRPEFVDLTPRSIMYHIHREGRPAAGFIAPSIADTKDAICKEKCPGRYSIYEHPTNGIPGQYVPVEWGHMTLHPDGRLEEARASPLRPRPIAEPHEPGQIKAGVWSGPARWNN